MPASRTAPTNAVRRRRQRSWYVYDWANSAYQTTVVAVFLGPYLTGVARQAACGTPDPAGCPPDARLHVLGLAVAPGAYYSYLLALSIVLQVLVLPVTGAVADRTRRTIPLLAAAAYTGAAATAAMYFVSGGRWLLGGLLYLIAQAAFGASVVVYNAFLPEVAGPDERDDVSARGWALGYLGGGLLLLANLVLFSVREALGLSTGQAVRISLLSAGLWWGLFTLVPLRGLRSGTGAAGDADLDSGSPPLSGSFAQLARTLAKLRRYPRTLLFLAAYLAYNDGIQSVIGLAAVYGSQELHFPETTIISAILLVQFVAFLGALALARLARVLGTRRTILASLVLWTVVLTGAYFLTPGASGQFFTLAAGIGVVLGGSQALSRSLFSQLTPRGEEAEYFSLYEISERGTSWLGALTFGLVYSLTGSYRQAILSLVVFFVLGFGLLAALDVRRAIAEAGNSQPVTV